MKKLSSGPLIICFLIIISGCEEREKNTDIFSQAIAIPDGVYELSKPKCDSTDQSPDYANATDGSQKASESVLDFDDLITSTLTLEDDVEVITLANPDCQLTITRNVYKNQGSTLQHTKEVYYQWTPAGCDLTKTVSGTKYVSNANRPDNNLIDNTDTGTDIRFVLSVSKMDGGYKRQTGFTDLRNYGCDKVDSIYQLLYTIEEQTDL
ncbi:MAG: hypothetical protein HQM12_23265 [SAR324 cluster bacterium]|nr:hypothetical protein [SAR324 cluster bacterium]